MEILEVFSEAIFSKTRALRLSFFYLVTVGL